MPLPRIIAGPSVPALCRQCRLRAPLPLPHASTPAARLLHTSPLPHREAPGRNKAKRFPFASRNVDASTYGRGGRGFDEFEDSRNWGMGDNRRRGRRVDELDDSVNWGRGERREKRFGKGGDKGREGRGSYFQQRDNPPQITIDAFNPKPRPRAAKLVRAMVERLPTWLSSERNLERTRLLGLDDGVVLAHGKGWLEAVLRGCRQAKTDGPAREALDAAGWDTEELMLAMWNDRLMATLESQALRRLLTSLAASPSLPETSRTHLGNILRTTDLTHLQYSNEYLSARSMHRHFHLHIGPTNSGKTYNALKALARAGSGAYAGPLRLLAHEVWERMNLGSVGGLDGEGRACNLLTGEERRVVDLEAGLLSCTVEMLPTSGPGGEAFDVVVVDEIQMMGDEQRGGAWTRAVMSCAAKEIHLCGDETTHDLLKRLITSVGDSLTVHRYDRLTPLVVADESPDGDFTKIEEGDCIVTFSRSGIFSLKKQVESRAGKKCAVVYGALPPETRAEQARDFNDEEGSCKVMIASDAVGMGLNLKIKRIIFDSLDKWNGKQRVPLSLMQIKQIAGRAGRFRTANDSTTTPTLESLAEDGDVSTPDETPAAGGCATTFRAGDLPILRELMTRSLPSIQRARIDPPYPNIVNLAGLLPESTTYREILEHFAALAQLPPDTVLSAPAQKLELADIVEVARDNISMSEVDLLTYAPVSVRSEDARKVFVRIVEAFSSKGCVVLDDILAESGMLETLESVEISLRALPRKDSLIPGVVVDALPDIESLHKALVLYIWMTFRLEVAFPERAEASELKMRSESVLEECLERMPGLQIKGKRFQKGVRTEDEVIAAQRARELAKEAKKIDWVSGKDVKAEQDATMWRQTALLGNDTKRATRLR
ncbi:hypothetical protein IAT38_002597 [Cryptococcus sp. DSM 104549]